MNLIHRNPWLLYLLLFFLPPVGLFLMFKLKKFNTPLRVILSLIGAFIFMIELAIPFTDTEPTYLGNHSSQEQTLPGKGTLKIHFIDVGQADSILIQGPEGSSVLVDAGNNEDGQGIVNYLKSQGVRELAAVVATHPHEDHIGGLDTVIKSFPVKQIYLPNATAATQTFEDMIAAINTSGATRIQAKAGVVLDVPGLSGVFLAPAGSGYDDLNNYSAVLKLTYGNTSFLLTGDAEAISESEMLKNGNLQATLLKVGHHGSSSSTSPAFLKAVSPKFAVISVGKDNSYGHPADETLSRLSSAGVSIYRTDLLGTIIATSDGNSITLDKDASPLKPNAPPTPAASVPQTPPASAAQTLPASSAPSTPPDSSPSSPPSSVPSTPPSSAPQALPASTPSTSTPPAAPASGGSLKITQVDLRGEMVTLTNSGGSVVDLTGWKLISEVGSQTFYFPAGTSLAPGGTLQILSGPDAQSGINQLLWEKANIWNNDGDTGALYDAQGSLVSRK